MNPSKRKGTAFESAVAAYLRECGFPAVERRALTGNKDRGDIAGVPGWVVECKAEKRIDLAAYAKEVAIERANANVPFGCTVVKRSRAPIADAYVVMDLKRWAALVVLAQLAAGTAHPHVHDLREHMTGRVTTA